MRHGETVIVTDRGRPVARLEPVTGSDEPGVDDGRLVRLERAGVVRRGRGHRLDEIARFQPPAPAAGGDIVAALLGERSSGR